MASLDTRRPAAQEQLRVLGEQAGIDTLPIVAGQTPVEIAERALNAGAPRRLRRGHPRHRRPHPYRRAADGRDGRDQAGRQPARDPARRRLRSPARTRSTSRKSFDERVGITGIVLTRVDGDGRGGAALSMRAVTGKPIKLHRRRREARRARGLRSRRASPAASSAWATSSAWSRRRRRASTPRRRPKAAERMRKGVFDLDDLAEQLEQMQKIGGMSGVMGMLPGVGKVKKQIDAMGIDDSVFKRQSAIISSMTDRRAQEPGPPQGQPQEAHRRRLRHQGRGDQQAAQDAPPDGRHDEGRWASGKGMFGKHGRHDGHARRGRRHAAGGPGGSSQKLAAPAAAGRLPGGLPAACPVWAARRGRGCPASAAVSRSSGLPKKK